MKAKEIQTRLNIIKLATTIGDHDVIILQTDKLKEVNSSKLNEIISLLYGKNYRQALYLIKNYLSEMGTVSDFEVDDGLEEGEKVLDIEDMLRMSPLAKDTIKEYKRTIYTNDDLETFAKNIEKPLNDEYKEIFSSKEEDKNDFIKDIEEEAKDNLKAKAQKSEDKELDSEQIEKLNSAIDSANSDTPLDEISSEVLGVKKNSSRLSKYKKLREKFAKKEPKKGGDSSIEEFKSSQIAKKVVENVQKDTNLDDSSNKIDEIKDIKEIETKDKDNLKEEIKNSNEPKLNDNTTKIKEDKQSTPESENKSDKDIIFSPIPHLEQKFRQAFITYPPVKESDSWCSEVVKFLKFASSNSFTQRDVKILMDDYYLYLDKGDIAKAAQILLLAASTDANFAKFILARELFSGKVIVRDIKKSFELMKSLANEFYPDAVCDLAQFYEYGIGVPKDKNVALKLYEKAFQLGVNRATKHINRLKESNGLLSSIFKLKLKK